MGGIVTGWMGDKQRGAGLIGGILPWPFGANGTPSRTNEQRASQLFMPIRPKSKRPTIKFQEASIISGMMICLWDNVSGPRTEQVWEGPAEQFDEEDLKYFCRHILGGEVGTKYEDESPEGGESSPPFKFHLLPEYGFLLTAVVFNGKYYQPNSQVSDSSTKWALVSFVRSELLERYLLIHDVVYDSINHLSVLFQDLLKDRPPDQALKVLRPQLELFVWNLAPLEKSSLPQLQFATTLFTRGPLFSMEFLARMITSHLQTFGCTVVIGENIDTVNSVIDTLGLFLSPEERILSCRAVEDRRYCPYLFLQGTFFVFFKIFYEIKGNNR